MNGIAALRVRRIGKAGLNIAGVDDGVGLQVVSFSCIVFRVLGGWQHIC